MTSPSAPDPRRSRARAVAATIPGVSSAGAGKTRRHRPSKLLALVALSGVAGLLVAFLALPVIGGVGATAKASADFFNGLPSALVQPPLAQRSVMVDSKGNRLATLHGPEDRVDIPLAQIPLVMRRAIISIEDRRFYEHHGVDYKGLLRAAFKNQETGEVTQGGSTLTQQYVKNVLLESATTPAEVKAATERTAKRKIQEARYALALERKLTKDQILANYLNITNFGDGAYGVEAAAQHYFGVSAKQLNVVQAATLAGIVNSPSAYNPKLHPKAALSRRNLVLNQMVVAKYLTPAVAKYAKSFGLGLSTAYVRYDDGCEQAGSAGFFCDYVRTTLLNDKSFGATREARERRLFEGGLTIRTSLDPVAQAKTQAAIDALNPAGGRIGTAQVVMKPGSGEVLAMAVNRVYGNTTDNKPAFAALDNGTIIESTDYVHTKLNYATIPNFQEGSTAKIFTLVAALNKGFSTSTIINSPACIYLTGVDNPLYPGQCVSDTPGVQAPFGTGFVNSDPAEAGGYNMGRATADSVNTYFVQLQKKIGGALPVRDAAVQLGVQAPRWKTTAADISSLTLGSLEVSVLDMATAYNTVAGHGLRCLPRPVTTMQTSKGKPVKYDGPGPCVQAIPPAVADTVTGLLENVITNGTASGNGYVDRPAAGKTGTTNEHYDAWFVGYTAQLTSAVWMADARNAIRYPMQGPGAVSTIPDGTLMNGVQQFSVFGGDMPTRIWAATMRSLSEGMPIEDFPPPAALILIPTTVGVPDVSNQNPYAASAILAGLGYTPILGGTQYSNAAAGLVAFTAPGAGSQVPLGSAVTIYISGGPAPAPPPPAPVVQPPPPKPTAPAVKPVAPATQPTKAGNGGGKKN